ncbi:MAG: tetratricopeptide repeat protein [Lachnospiraceae bacterium]|jgi:tetratricopeptide (TPR) repeat protein|nr:tetratricopeptide repeat protein [Lachnospiraceae bacterium]
MNCYNCGAELSNSDYCERCGADVSLYRRLIKLSNAYYNEGLEKARVRDLSGAAVALRQSVKANKKNTDARNLLGLVYFEMGEMVDALSQWIISKNFQSEKNLADEYIKSVQNSPARLDAINTTIKKYNQSLLYCEQGSFDLAVIQLKKILSTNPNLLKGHQLLALLYMKEDNFVRARAELQAVLNIDRTNTLALRYLKELDEAEGKQSKKQQPKREEEQVSKDAIVYTSGNETIIQPIGVKDNSWLHSIINIIIGIGIGMAVMWFLILPAQKQMESSELNDAVAEYSDQVEAKTAALNSLQAEMDTLKAESEAAIQSASEANEKLSSYEELLKAYRSYAEEDSPGALEKLEAINKEILPEDAQILYDAVFREVGAAAVAELYQTGYAAYQSNNFETSIADLGKCYELDNTQHNALYFLARSYHKSGDIENAKIYYQKVIDEAPGTRMSTDATNLLRSISN